MARRKTATDPDAVVHIDTGKGRAAKSAKVRASATEHVLAAIDAAFPIQREPRLDAPQVELNVFESSPLIQLVDDRLLPDVSGALVKYTPDIGADQRASFDAAKWRANFISRGARGVVIAPRVIGTATRARSPELVKRAAVSVHEAFDAWVEDLVGVDVADKDAARRFFDSMAGSTVAK